MVPNPLLSRRSFLAVLGGTLTVTAGCTQADPEPTGRPVDVSWKLDPESTGEYGHFRTLHDSKRDWTWFEGKFIATAQDIVGFEYDVKFYHEGDEIDRLRDDFMPGDMSALFVMEPGEFTTYEYAVQDTRIPTSFEVLVTQIEKE